MTIIISLQTPFSTCPQFRPWSGHLYSTTVCTNVCIYSFI